MKLFKMINWELTLDEKVWGLDTFKKLLDRDKTKEKEVVHAEMLFIWYFCDIKSDFLFLPEKERTIEIKKEIPGLSKKWKIDKDVREAIDLYTKLSETTLQFLYKNAVKSAQVLAEELGNSRELLDMKDVAERPVYKISDIARGVKEVPIIMRNLKDAEREVIKESKDNEGKSKGAQQFNTFEGGLNFEN